MATEKFYGTGRRKKSIARVYLVPGTGKVTINKRDIDEYLGLETLKLIVRQPLVATETVDKFDVLVNVHGGGNQRTGRRYPSRHRESTGSRGCRLQTRSQESRFPDPRSENEREKEVRPQSRPSCASVQQAIKLFQKQLKNPETMAVFGVFPFQILCLVLAWSDSI